MNPIYHFGSYMDTHEKILAHLEQNNPGLVLPPPVLELLGGRYTSLKMTDGETVSLSLEIPFRKEFTNPAGFYQGGMLAAALDEALGPLCVLASRKLCPSLDLQLTFLRSFREKDGKLLIKGELLQRSTQFLFLRAEGRNPQGEIVVTAHSHCFQGKA